MEIGDHMTDCLGMGINDCAIVFEVFKVELGSRGRSYGEIGSNQDDGLLQSQEKSWEI